MFKWILTVFASFLLGIATGFFTFYQFNHLPQQAEPKTLQPISQVPKETAFSLENAPTNSLRGEISTMSGEIYWQSRMATEPAKLEMPILVQQGEKLIASSGGTIQIKFASAAATTLEAQSELEIIQTLPVNLVFNQTKGTINYQNNTSSPLSIRTYALLTNLYNASIAVNYDDITHTSTLEVKNGEVKVAYNNKDYVSQIINLKSGDEFTYNGDTRRGTKR